MASLRLEPDVRQGWKKESKETALNLFSFSLDKSSNSSKKRWSIRLNLAKLMAISNEVARSGDL